MYLLWYSIFKKYTIVYFLECNIHTLNIYIYFIIKNELRWTKKYWNSNRNNVNENFFYSTLATSNRDYKTIVAIVSILKNYVLLFSLFDSLSGVDKRLQKKKKTFYYSGVYQKYFYCWSIRFYNIVLLLILACEFINKYVTQST